MSDRDRRGSTRRMSTASTRLAAGPAQHVYVYAVAAGKPAAGRLSRVPAMPDGARPRALALNSALSLVVSDVPADVYNTESLERRLSDLDWVAACGAAHHAAADALSKSTTIVPLRMFTIFSSETKALAALRRVARRLARTLARVQGRKEWVLRIGQPDPARRETPAASPAAPSSGASFLRGKADARRAQAARIVRAKESAAAVYAALEHVADAAVMRAPEQASNLVLDAAFLVSTRRTAAFRKALTAAAGALLAEGCPVSLTGPWPPYSFATLEGATR
jgi:hypothetical protein